MSKRSRINRDDEEVDQTVALFKRALICDDDPAQHGSLESTPLGATSSSPPASPASASSSSRRKRDDSDSEEEQTHNALVSVCNRVRWGAPQVWRQIIGRNNQPHPLLVRLFLLEVHGVKDVAKSIHINLERIAQFYI